MKSSNTLRTCHPNLQCQVPSVGNNSCLLATSSQLLSLSRALHWWSGQRPQPTQIIWVCPDIWVFSVLGNRLLSDIWVICQKCQFEVSKGWMDCSSSWNIANKQTWSSLFTFGAWMHYIYVVGLERNLHKKWLLAFLPQPLGQLWK